MSDLDFTIVHGLAERSPLHPSALNFDDLKVGLRIQQRTRYNRDYRRTSRIIEMPYKLDFSPDIHGQQSFLWKLPVKTLGKNGIEVEEHLILVDKGIMPRHGTDGIARSWHEQNYCTAV